MLRGIFLLRREEVQFFYQSGTSFMFPDAFERYKSCIPEVEQCNLISAFHRRLTGTNEEEKLKVREAEKSSRASDGCTVEKRADREAGNACH